MTKYGKLIDIGTATDRCTEKRRRALLSVLGCDVAVKPSDEDAVVTGTLIAVENGGYVISDYPEKEYYKSKDLRELRLSRDSEIDREFNVNFRR
jgi:hypothetical protein